jgi:hypothetical protein
MDMNKQFWCKDYSNSHYWQQPGGRIVEKPKKTKGIL